MRTQTMALAPAEEAAPEFRLFVVGRHGAAVTRGILKARWLFFESPSRFRLLLEHDVFRKPVPTFRHHALACRDGYQETAPRMAFTRSVFSQENPPSGSGERPKWP